MCTELEGITMFVYLATWCIAIYYVTNPKRRVLRVTALIVANAALLCVHLNSHCSIHYIKAGAATEAVLLFVLFKMANSPASEESQSIEPQSEAHSTPHKCTEHKSTHQKRNPSGTQTPRSHSPSSRSPSPSNESL